MRQRRRHTRLTSVRLAPMRAARLLTATLVLTATAPPVQAQTSVTVQSGEHADFSRLAMIFPEATEWEVQTVEDGWSIRFSPPVALDVTGVFGLIPRDRIESVSQQPDGSLLIGRGCECRLDVFEVRPRVIAMDVRHIDAGEAEPESAAQPPGPLPPGLTISATSLPVAELFPALPGQRFADGSEAFEASRDTRDAPQDPAFGSTPVADLADALREDLARAAEAGLIDLAPAADGTQSEDPPDAPLLPALDRSRNVDLRTGRDLSSRIVSPAAEPEIDCPEEEFFDFLTDGRRETWVASLASLRSGLVDERGAVTPEGALALAKGYLRLGFGAEARQLLAQAGGTEKDRDVLASLSRIMDDRSDDAPGTWSGLERCETSAALWALLGQDVGQQPDNQTSGLAAGAIQTAFFTLPEHLRLHLGSEVAARLDRTGAPDAAAAIENNLAALRTPIPPSASEGGPTETLPAGATAPVVQPGALTSDLDSLLSRMEAAMAAGQPLASDDLDVADALAGEFAGTEAGSRLRNAIALGQLQRGDIGAALAHFSAGSDAEATEGANRAETTREGGLDLGETMRGALTRSLVALSDAGLLRVVTHPDGALLHGVLSDADAIRVADRLVDLGFPADAERILAGRAAAPDGDLAVAQARAHVAGGDPRRALVLLAGRDDRAATRIRAQAYAELGDRAAAAALFAASEDPAEAARLAWLTGDPRFIREYGTEEQRALLSTLAPPSAPTEDDALSQSVADALADVEPQSPGAPVAAPPAEDAGAAADITAQAAGGEPWTVERARDLLARGERIRSAVLALERAGAEGE